MSEASSAPGNPPAAPKKKRSGVIVPHQPRRRQRLAAVLVYVLLRLMAATVRFRVHDRSGLVAGNSNERIIFAIWHNRLALSLKMYRRYVSRYAPDRRLAAMVSASRDGGFLAGILKLFGVEPVRGSSSRRGPQALREMVSAAERGLDLAITPDGPRGPCYKVQEGVISAAQLTGLAIVPVSYRLAWKIRSKSWDRFQIPLPFTRCDIHAAPPIRVPREASDAEREALRKQLEQTLREITHD
jgi:lysophospholipid acyltransferase (LPLAT)-like uncharacterized protein